MLFLIETRVDNSACEPVALASHTSLRKALRPPNEEAPYQHLRGGDRLRRTPSERAARRARTGTATLGVPRAAVPKTLVRLAQEHLVERLFRRGARVQCVTFKEAVELLESRMALECLAVEHAACNATARDIAALRAILVDMEGGLSGDLLSYGETNARLHREIMRIADHTIVERLLDSLRSRNTFFHLRAVIVPNDPRVRLAEHRRIVDTIEAHDPSGYYAGGRSDPSTISPSVAARSRAETAEGAARPSQQRPTRRSGWSSAHTGTRTYVRHLRAFQRARSRPAAAARQMLLHGVRKPSRLTRATLFR